MQEQSRSHIRARPSVLAEQMGSLAIPFTETQTQHTSGQNSLAIALAQDSGFDFNFSEHALSDPEATQPLQHNESKVLLTQSQRSDSNEEKRRTRTRTREVKEEKKRESKKEKKRRESREEDEDGYEYADEDENEEDRKEEERRLRRLRRPRATTRSKKARRSRKKKTKEIVLTESYNHEDFT